MKIEELYSDIEINPADTIVFGCSYGPDSMALFKSLLMLREKCRIHLVCAHVHHGKRRESDDEKIALEKYCQKNQVIFEYMKIEEYGDDNFHNEARNIRYHFFEQLAEKYHAKCIMTAHHGDDLMETILMRIVRGSTLEGYSGFKKKMYLNGFLIYRPFIFMSKNDLLEFNKKYHVEYAIDASNDSMVYTRNRYRKVVLPFLKQEDPFVHYKFLKFSHTLQEANDYIHQQMSNAINKVMRDEYLLIEPFLKQDLFLQRRILEDYLRRFYQDDLILIGEKHIDLLLKFISSKKANATVSLPNDVSVVKEYQKLYLRKNTAILSNYEIEVGDHVILPNHHVLKRVLEVNGNSNYITRLSSKNVILPLRVRTREIGDRIFMKGGGHKKVKDIFIDKKIPVKDRDMWPIVVDGSNRIVFIPGLKKSKFDRKKEEFYDIILKYE